MVHWYKNSGQPHAKCHNFADIARGCPLLKNYYCTCIQWQKAHCKANPVFCKHAPETRMLTTQVKKVKKPFENRKILYIKSPIWPFQSREAASLKRKHWSNFAGLKTSTGSWKRRRKRWKRRELKSMDPRVSNLSLKTKKKSPRRLGFGCLVTRWWLNTMTTGSRYGSQYDNPICRISPPG